MVSIKGPRWDQYRLISSPMTQTVGLRADDTKMSGAIDLLEGRDAIQRDLDRLKECTHATLMKFNKAKCNVLHPGQDNHRYQYKLWDEGFESSHAKKDLGVVVYCILGCIKSSMACRSREVILPPRSALTKTPPGVLCPALEPSAQERHAPVGMGPEEGHKNYQRAGTPLL